MRPTLACTLIALLSRSWQRRFRASLTTGLLSYLRRFMLLLTANAEYQSYHTQHAWRRIVSFVFQKISSTQKVMTLFHTTQRQKSNILHSILQLVWYRHTWANTGDCLKIWKNVGSNGEQLLVHQPLAKPTAGRPVYDLDSRTLVQFPSLVCQLRVRVHKFSLWICSVSV